MPDKRSLARWERVANVPDYEVVDADLGHACDDALAVWGNSIGWPGRQAEMYRRYYLECPVGRPELKFLRHVPSGQLVGTLGVGPRRLWWKGRELRAGMLSHFCVVQAHRRIKPPILLIKLTAEACRDRYDVLYAMPRTPQAAALGRLFGDAPACYMSRRVKVLRYAKYAVRRLPSSLAKVAGGLADAATRFGSDLRGGTGGLEGRWVDRVDPRMAELWRRSTATPLWNAARDIRMLHWRFDRLPSTRRRYLLVEDARGRLLAWFACDSNFFDPEILVVEDFWGDDGPAGIEPAAIRVLCREAAGLGFCAVEVRAGAPAALQAWAREGFVERNRYPVFTAWLTPSVAAGPGDVLHLTELDNDG
jgi:hypothetical protein